MMVEIDESTVKSTTNCNKGMPCLYGVKESLCEVEYCVMDKVYFVNCLSDKRCHYRLSFGNKLLCTCPI